MNVPSVPELAPPTRLLLGPGPSTVHPRVLRAMSTPLLGHLDPKFLEIMNEVQAQLRAVFRTAEPVHDRGLRHRVGRHGGGAREPARAGRHGRRRAPRACSATAWPTSSAGRGAKLVKLEVPWGETFDLGRIEEALKKEGKVKVVAIVHAETSTGAHQPLDGLGKLVPRARRAPRRRHRHVARRRAGRGGRLGDRRLLLGHAEVPLVPAGPRAAHALRRARSRRCRRARRRCRAGTSTLGMVADYWAEGKRAYHHTAPISMVYALREALRIVLEEGLEARFARHRRHSAALMAGLAALGCAPAGAGGPPAARR